MKLARGTLGEQALVIPPPGSTWDPANKSTTIATSGGNLTATGSSNANFSSVKSTTSKSAGKLYFECADANGGASGTPDIGIASAAFPVQNTVPIPQPYLGFSNDGVGFLGTGDVRINNATVLSTGDPWATAGQIARVAINFPAQLIWFGRVGSGLWNGNAPFFSDPAAGTGGITFAALGAGPFFITASLFFSTDQVILNVGSSAFAGAVPAGFSAWG